MRTRTVPYLLGAVVAVLAAVVAVGAWPGPASAHNTFVSSEPADGAVVAAPDRISFRFTLAVPLESATVQLIDATGARTELTGLAHGPAGDTELVAPLPALAPGEVTVRWRLVGPDGHPLTDRVVFTVAAASPTTNAASVPAGAPAVTTAPPATSPRPVGAALDDDGAAGAPSALRWLLRYGAYVAIMVVVGVVVTDALVWPGAAGAPVLRRSLAIGTAVVAGTAVAQFVVLAWDLAGGRPGLGDLESAGATPVGTALVVRLLLVGWAWLLLREPSAAHGDVRWSVLGLTGAGLLGTWAFAGHASSQRWPHVGVPLDVLHHLAAAAWIGGLAIVGLVAVPSLDPASLGRVFRRLSTWAATAVAVVVLTGAAQGVRLVGNPADLLGGTHGRALAAKLAVLAAMLAVANANRRRVTARLGAGVPGAATVTLLRRGVLTELALGLVVIGVTAAMVVSPPAAGG